MTCMWVYEYMHVQWLKSCEAHAILYVLLFFALNHCRWRSKMATIESYFTFRYMEKNSREIVRLIQFFFCRVCKCLFAYSFYNFFRFFGFIETFIYLFFCSKFNIKYRMTFAKNICVYISKVWNEEEEKFWLKRNGSKREFIFISLNSLISLKIECAMHLETE